MPHHALGHSQKSLTGAPQHMYFWRIEKLKSEMAARPLSEREVLPYLVVYVALSAAVSYLPPTTYNVWDGLGAVWSTLLAVVGTIYIYRQNGGADGQHFLQRYFAIGQVVAMRWLAFVMLPVVALYIAMEELGSDTESTHWYDFLFGAVIEAAFYWRVGYHVRDLAQRTTSPNLEPES